MKTPNSRKWLVSLSISIEVVGDKGVTFPFTDLPIHDGFENGKHLLTEEGSWIMRM